MTLPQLTDQVLGTIPVYELAFVNTVPGVGTILETQFGGYNASIAQNIFTTGFCQTHCNSHVPILWNSPVPIAAYGGATIQGDAIGSTGSWLFVAAASNNLTALYFSPNYGTNGSWYSLTGNHPALGASPKLAVSPCNALLTTLTSSNLIATQFSLPCGKPWAPPPPPPPPSPPSGGGGHPPSNPPPTVSIVIPSQSPNASTVFLNGSGYSSVSMVTFGGVPSSHFTVLSTTYLSAVVSNGWGTVPVQVTAGGMQSQVTCASALTHGTALAAHTPEVSSVFPTAAPAGSTVSIYGAYFQSTSGVKFGTLTASGVTLVSAGVLHATVPLWTGTVNVTVTNTVGTSPTAGCADQFTIQAIPSVISVTPDQGPASTSTAIWGRNFLLNASVYFGATVSTTVTVHNSTSITAVAPAGSSGSTVNVTVHQVGYTSAISCADNFTYGPAVAVNAPQIEWLSPTANASFGSVVIAGYYFQPSAVVTFGGVPAPIVYYATSTLLQVEVPLGVGTVPVQVSESTGSSLATCADRFTIQLPQPLANFTAKTWTLPRALDASPTFVGGNQITGLNSIGAGVQPGILASNASDSKIIFYRLNSTTELFVPTKIAPFAAFNASSPLFSLGQTSLIVANGTSGQVAAVSSGQSVFGLFTTLLNGVYVGESIGSADGGATWGGPYAASVGVGSIRDPQATLSPAGYVYVVWRDNSGGPWRVDQSVYWPSGLSLVPPAPLKGSGGGVLSSAGPPAVVVDPYGRPLYAWAISLFAGGSGGLPPAGPVPTAGWSGIAYTGAFVSAYSALRTISAGFNATVPSDFENFGGTGLHTFRASVNATIRILQNDTANKSRLCLSEQLSLGRLYPNVTQTAPPPTVMGAALPGCPLSEGQDNSILFASSGPFSANTYLEVQASNLIEATGVGTMPVPLWFAGLFSPPPPRIGSFVPGVGATWADSHGDSIQVTPTTLNSGTILLGANGVFWSKSNSTGNIHNATTICGTTSNFDRPILFSTNLTIKNIVGATTAVHTYTSTGQLPDIYVTLLRALRNGTWSERISVTYQEIQSSTNYCPSGDGFNNTTKVVPIPTHDWPTNFTKTLNGTYTTGLGYYPSNLTLNSTGVNGNSGIMNDSVAWQNTIYASAKAWLNQTSTGTPYNAVWSNGAYQLPEYLHGSGFQSIPVGRTYKLTTLIQTKNGSLNSSWWPVLDGRQVSIPPPVEKLSFACPSFVQLANYQRLWWYSASNVTNITGDSATITWFSNGNNSGWVDYLQSSGMESNQTAQVLRISPGNGTYYEYVAQLHGLQPWGAYSVVAHVRAVSTCVQYLNQTTKWQFQTQASIQLAEQDLPYDSITRQGGGAQLYFQVPNAFSAWSTFKNGSLTYYPTSNSSAMVTTPLGMLPGAVWSSLPNGLGNTYVNTTYVLNLTGLTPNATYNASLSLNYTTVGNAVIHASSLPFLFRYAKASTSDGLGDAEKVRGWNVTTLTPWNGPTATYRSIHVTANPALYATNGLVNDSTEKRFGLNPRTIDSSGSHMLDTWNLSFILAGHGPSCPTGFQCWYENTTNPFLSPQYPHGTGNGTAVRVNNTTGPHNLVDDSSGYDATVLWQNARIQYLQGLIQNESLGWLRAVVGYYSPAHDWTLTVEGKLSWGANPLARSTPGDGIPDGNRVNPLGASYVSVTVTQWNDTNLGSGSSVAAFVNSNSTISSYPFVQTDYNGYTQQVLAGSYLSGWRSLYGGNLNLTYTFPVVDTVQYARLNVSLVQNSGGISNAINIGPINVDLASATAHPASRSSSGVSLSITYQALAVYSKAPTYILVPNDNSTLSNLPLGLKRYAGEQNFVLITVRDTATALMDRSYSGIPYPLANGSISKGTYNLSLQSGVNNFLIPRAMFLSTPIGQDILNATLVTIQNNSKNSPLATHYNATQWSARSTLGNHNGYNYTGTSSFITIFSNGTTQACSANAALCGGVLTNPNLESGHSALAIGAIITLNISSQADLENLMAGLLLNHSGNFTSWLFEATQFLPSLGLSPTVLNVLAASVQANAGSFGAPQSVQTGSALWTVSSLIWNTVSGVVGSLEVVWNAVVAALAYVYYLASVAGGWLLGALHQVASVLKNVASAIAWAFSQLVQFIKPILVALFSAVLAPIASAMLNLISSIIANADLVRAASVSNFANSTATPITQGGALSKALAPALILSVGFGIAFAIGLNVVSSLSLGATFIIPIILILVQTSFSLANPFSASMGQSNTVSHGVGLLSSILFNAVVGIPQYIFNATNQPLTSFDILPLGSGNGGGSGGLRPHFSSSLAWNDYWSYFGAMLGVLALVTALVGVGFASVSKRTTGISEAAATVALVISILALAFVAFAAAYDTTLPSSCKDTTAHRNQFGDYQAFTIIALVMSAGAGVGAFGALVYGDTSSATIITAICAGLISVAAMWVGMNSLAWVHSKC